MDSHRCFDFLASFDRVSRLHRDVRKLERGLGVKQLISRFVGVLSDQFFAVLDCLLQTSPDELEINRPAIGGPRSNGSPCEAESESIVCDIRKVVDQLLERRFSLTSRSGIDSSCSPRGGILIAACQKVAPFRTLAGWLEQLDCAA